MTGHLVTLLALTAEVRLLKFVFSGFLAMFLYFDDLWPMLYISHIKYDSSCLHLV